MKLASHIMLIFASVFYLLPLNAQTISSPENKGGEVLGKHIIAEFWGGKIIEDDQLLEDLLLTAVKEANCIPVNTIKKKFEPQGVTILVLLTESHASIHTWPEFNYMAIDIFSCGTNALPIKAIFYLQKEIQPMRIEVKECNRGEWHPAHLPSKSTPNEMFGQELTLDLKECDPDLIRSKEVIQVYIDQLCSLIDMEKYGEPFIERFALNTPSAGYSFAQMITTSLVSGHLTEKDNSAYINIFSCKSFDCEDAIAFTKRFFGAQSINFCDTIR